jgi:hypothetical protein
MNRNKHINIQLCFKHTILCKRLISTGPVFTREQEDRTGFRVKPIPHQYHVSFNRPRRFNHSINMYVSTTQFVSQPVSCQSLLLANSSSIINHQPSTKAQEKRRSQMHSPKRPLVAEKHLRRLTRLNGARDIQKLSSLFRIWLAHSTNVFRRAYTTWWDYAYDYFSIGHRRQRSNNKDGEENGSVPCVNQHYFCNDQQLKLVRVPPTDYMKCVAQNPWCLIRQTCSPSLTLNVQVIV